MKLFRNISAAEEADFKKWARENYAPYGPIEGTWHPIIQSECTAMNIEANLEFHTAEPREEAK